MQKMKERKPFNILSYTVKAILRYMTLVFVTLRACDVIDWAWYVVLSPVIALLTVALICCAILGFASVAEAEDD